MVIYEMPVDARPGGGRTMEPRNYLWAFGLGFLVVALLIAGLSIWAFRPKPLSEGTALCYEVLKEPGGPADIVDQTIRVLKQRVDPHGLVSLEWRPISGSRFEIRMPTEQALSVKRLIARAGVLEFRIAPELPKEIHGAGDEKALNLSLREYQDYVDRPVQIEGRTVGRIREHPDALRERRNKLLWFPIRGVQKDFAPSTVIGTWQGQDYILLYDRLGYVMLHKLPGDSGAWRLEDARPDMDSMGRRCVTFTLDRQGARAFSNLTMAHIGHLLAILMDGEVYSAPRIRSVISDQGQITGSFSADEQRELVRMLNAGALPAQVKLISQYTFGPAGPEKSRPQKNDTHTQGGRGLSFLNALGW